MRPEDAAVRSASQFIGVMCAMALNALTVLLLDKTLWAIVMNASFLNKGLLRKEAFEPKRDGG